MSTETQEQRQDWRNEPWVPVVTALISIGFAAWGGWEIAQGGKAVVWGIALIGQALFSYVPPAWHWRYFLLVNGPIALIVAVDLIWEPWSW